MKLSEFYYSYCCLHSSYLVLQPYKQFKKLVVDAVAECWDQTIYDDNTPDEDYDYKANNEEEPESIDLDNDLYDDPENLEKASFDYKG